MNKGLFAPLLLVCASAATAAPIDCRQGQCDLVKKGAYPSVVIATVDHVGTDDELGSVYQWASDHRYWSKLPKGKRHYLAAAKLIAVKPPAEDSFPYPSALLMGSDEFNAVPLDPGDLVRYAPHRSGRDAPKGNAKALAIYWGATGCIAVLCRASDQDCKQRYRQGIYSRETGAEVDARNGTPIRGGVVVDTMTWLPVDKPAAPR